MLECGSPLLLGEELQRQPAWSSPGVQELVAAGRPSLPAAQGPTWTHLVTRVGAQPGILQGAGPTLDSCGSAPTVVRTHRPPDRPAGHSSVENAGGAGLPACLTPGVASRAARSRPHRSGEGRCRGSWASGQNQVTAAETTCTRPQNRECFLSGPWRRSLPIPIARARGCSPDIDLTPALPSSGHVCTPDPSRWPTFSRM